MTGLSRRTLVGGGIAVGALAVLGGAAAAVDRGVLPGRSEAYRLLGLDGPAGRLPDAAPGPLRSGGFVSAARAGTKVGWTVAYPPGAQPGDSLPVLISLHGYSGSHRSSFGTAGLGLDRFLSAAVAGGAAPFAIASIDGGERYWHRRADGDDPAAMVSDEFVPLLARAGLDIGSLGLFGWSMGGYGALHVASLLHEAAGSGGASPAAGAGTSGSGSPVKVVVAESPAIWHSYREAASIAFDSASDFAANALWGRESQLDGVAVRVDCGTGDGFCPAARDYVAQFPAAHRPAGGFERGAHDMDYWRRMAPAQLAFAARHLAA